MSPGSSDTPSRLARLEQRADSQGDTVTAIAAMPLEVARLKEAMDNVEAQLERNRVECQRGLDKIGSRIWSGGTMIAFPIIVGILLKVLT